MRQDQLKILYVVTLVVFILGIVLEWMLADSISGAVRNAVIGLSASLLAATLIASYAEWSSLGIVRYYQEWLSEQPNLRKAFREAKTVEICAITFWNSLFGQEWFREAFRERVSARIEGKDTDTKILLLKPGGIEITRRQAEGRPQEEGMSLNARNDAAVKLLCEVLREEGVTTGYGEFLRFFDYSPGVNWMRVDERGFLVLLGHGSRGKHRGGLSPGLLLQKRLGGGATLFDVYDRNFRGMWLHAEPARPTAES